MKMKSKLLLSMLNFPGLTIYVAEINLKLVDKREIVKPVVDGSTITSNSEIL